LLFIVSDYFSSLPISYVARNAGAYRSPIPIPQNSNLPRQPRCRGTRTRRRHRRAPRYQAGSWTAEAVPTTMRVIVRKRSWCGQGVSGQLPYMSWGESRRRNSSWRRSSRRAEPGRSRTPEPMGLGITHLLDDEDRPLNSPRCPLSSTSSRAHSKHSTPLHRAPFPLSNSKSHISRAWSKPKPRRRLHLSKSPNLPNLPRPSRLPRCSLTWKIIRRAVVLRG
jgi:hypothetical protein